MKKTIFLILVLLFFIWSTVNAYNYHPQIESPQLSPDSQSIYFTGVLNEESGWQLFCMRADGTGLRLIDTPQLSPFLYSISPDGKRIAFIAHKFEGYEGPHLYIINSDGTGLMDLGLKDVAQTTPVWTTDGQRIIFTGSFGTDKGEYLLSIKQDGSDLKQLTKFGAAAVSMAKNGELLFFGNKKVKYLLGLGVKYELMKIDEDGTGLQKYFKPEDAYWLRNISPNGEKLLFSKTEKNNQFGFWISDKKRKNMKRISTGKDNEVTSDNSPSWSSDSSKIVYTKGNYGETQSIWLMNSDGTDHREIASFEKYLTAKERVIISASDKNKEYVSTQFSFSFDYPDNWVIEDGGGGTYISLKPPNWDSFREKSDDEIDKDAIVMRVVKENMDSAARDAGFVKIEEVRDDYGDMVKDIPDNSWVMQGRQGALGDVASIQIMNGKGLKGEGIYGRISKKGYYAGLGFFYISVMTNKNNTLSVIINWGSTYDDEVVGNVYDIVAKSFKFNK